MPAIKQLMSVVESLLREKALDEITVSEIVAEKKLCQETFYRNYTDKYDLADSYYTVIHHISVSLFIQSGDNPGAHTQNALPQSLFQNWGSVC